MLDITTTPDSEFFVLSKGMWLLIAGAFWIFGAGAWLLVGRPQRPALHRYGRYGDGVGPAEALLRHPATQAVAGYPEAGNWAANFGEQPLGPDDDPDFLEELHRRIHGPLDDA